GSLPSGRLPYIGALALNIGTSGSISTEQAAPPPRNNQKQIQTIIKELQENEFVERQGSARSGKWVVKHIQKTD
ncbi:hypothetical protein ACTQ5A_09195, partial [Bacillota bacterium LCP21S3_F9]